MDEQRTDQEQKDVEPLYCVTPGDLDRLRKNFIYHAPKPGQVERYTFLRDAARRFAVVVIGQCPESREKSLALTKIEEAVMWANAGIARNE